MNKYLKREQCNDNSCRLRHPIKNPDDQKQYQLTTSFKNNEHSYKFMLYLTKSIKVNFKILHCLYKKIMHSILIQYFPYLRVAPFDLPFQQIENHLYNSGAQIISSVKIPFFFALLESSFQL